MSAAAQVATPTSMAEFLATIVEGETFSCPLPGKTHTGRKKGNFSANGATKHIGWCEGMQVAYNVAPATKKAAAKPKAKPTQLEDAALRGWAGRPRTQRRDARQVENPVGQQDNTVRPVGKVRVTGGYVDPATMPAGWDVDKNGRELKGFALTKRVEKLIRDGAVAVTTQAPASTPAPAQVEALHGEGDLDGIYTRLLVIESEIARFKPVVEALEGYVAAQDDMIEPAS